MSQCVIWAINPNNKPSNMQLREIFASNGNLVKRRNTHGFKTDVINGIGIVPIEDALYTSDYRRISAYIEELNENPMVRRIVLDINSPGGMVSGAIECASIISKSKKPVDAYVEGLGCSAAYLLASAASRIIATPASEIGSIGVQASWTNNEGLLAKLGIQKVYFHSKFSDKKNLSPSSKEGEDAIKKNLDETWDLFSSAIEKNRKIDENTLVEKYGQGEVFLAKESKDRGLIDMIVNDFDEYMEQQPQGGEGEFMAEITTVEALTSTYPELVAQIQGQAKATGEKEGETKERARAMALVGLTKYTEKMDVITDAVKEGKTVEEATKSILDAQLAEKAEAKTNAISTLAETAKESKKEMVEGAIMPEAITKEGETKEQVNQMCENIKGAKK